MTETLNIELLGEVPFYVGMGIQTITALALGGLVGFDREKKSKAAGLKTHMLICLGAMIFTSMGIMAAVIFGGTADPNRIAAQIVSGIGFLGAGAIIKNAGSSDVVGLTSAATIWLVAAIGYTVGIGYAFSAIAFTVTVFIVLTAIGPFYKLFEREGAYKYYQLEVLSRGSIKRVLLGIVLNEQVEVDEVFEEDYDGKKGRLITSVFLKAHSKQMERIAYETNALLKTEKVTHHSVVGSVNKIIKSYKSGILDVD
jgi:putative Mg2+ transporter-C (MgtC) family protein